MFKAACFGKRIACLILLCLAVAGLAVPASAVLAVPDLKIEDRQMSVIRYGASRYSYNVGNLDNGTQLTVLSETESFYRIDCYGMNCYIAKEQVRVDNNGCYYVNCDPDSSETTTLPCKDIQDVEQLRMKAVQLAKDQLGVPYVWGGTTPYGFDCSGLVQYLFGQLGYRLNRTCSPQLSNGMAVDPKHLEPGDILFFENTTYDSGISSHVGIYVGDGLLIHAGSGHVSYGSLKQSYFIDHFLCARRVLLPGIVSHHSALEFHNPKSRGLDPADQSFSFTQLLNGI